MKDLNWYLDTASKRAGIESDRKLSVRLGLGETAVNQMRTGRTWPSDAAMLHLSALAGVTPEEALLDLNHWRSKNADVRRTYESLMAFVKSTAAALLLVIGITGTQPAQADTNRATTVYYGK